MALPDQIFDRLIEQIYSGSASIFELPEYLYAWTVTQLDNSIFFGFGEIDRKSVV